MGSLFLMSELLGYAIFTEPESFDENSLHSYSGGLGYRFGRFVPRCYYKHYFDDEFDGYEGIIGLALYVEL